MHLDPDFREFVESFNAHEVRYLVVGDHALAAHGLPRATGQFDAWVWVGGDNAERILAALTAFGFGALGLEVVDFDHPDSIVQLGYPPYRIDILTSIDGVEFDDAWSHRLSIEVGGLPLELIGRDDLDRNKVGANRRQDRVDVADLTQEDPHRLTTSGRRTAAGHAGGWRARAGSGAPVVTPGPFSAASLVGASVLQPVAASVVRSRRFLARDPVDGGPHREEELRITDLVVDVNSCERLSPGPIESRDQEVDLAFLELIVERSKGVGITTGRRAAAISRRGGDFWHHGRFSATCRSSVRELSDTTLAQARLRGASGTG